MSLFSDNFKAIASGPQQPKRLTKMHDLRPNPRKVNFCFLFLVMQFLFCDNFAGRQIAGCALVSNGLPVIMNSNHCSLNSNHCSRIKLAVEGIKFC